MDPPRFVNHYSAISNAMRFCGLATPWIKKPSSLLLRIPYLIWDTIQTAIVVYMLCCYVYSITTIYISFQDLCGLGISTASFIGGLLLTIFYGVCGRRLKKITDHMDSIAETIMMNDLGEAELFYKLYKSNSKLMSFFTNLSVRFSAFLPFIYCLAVPFTDFFTGNYRTRFPFKINSPFDDRQPGLYEMLALMQTCCVSTAYAKKTTADCIIVTLFRMETDFLKYMSASMHSLQKDFMTDSRGLVRKKLVLWVKLHQNVIQNIRELIKAFSPVIVIYYVSVICNIVCAVFIQVKKDNETFVQSITMSIYITVALTYLFLLSNTAHQLTSESEKLAFTTYSTPWFEFDKGSKDVVNMVVNMSTIPVGVTAYKAQLFLLNRQTFTGFIATALSAVVTFVQMKEKYDE